MTSEEYEAFAKNIRTAEGLRLTAYKDSVGVWTIGYGTNLQTLTIDPETAERWLREKSIEVEHECRIRFAWFLGMSSARQFAVLEMVYNLGINGFLKFKKMIRALEIGDYATARAEALDSVWRTQVGDTRANRIADAILNG